MLPKKYCGATRSLNAIRSYRKSFLTTQLASPMSSYSKDQAMPSRPLPKTDPAHKSTYDYVIVGAGTAGCVLANRLSAHNPNDPIGGVGPTVALLEAGPTDHGITRWSLEMPAALAYNRAHEKYNWSFRSVPQLHLRDREMACPQGRVLGGSSSLNAMVYVRGHALDYERWHQEGAEGWSYANCLPYFRKSQTHERGPDEYHGFDGPVFVSRGKSGHPLHKAWVEACQQAGHTFTDDINGYRQEGAGYLDMTIRDGERCSASVAYLHPIVEHRPNLSVKTNALVERILFDKHRAIGVQYEQNGETWQVLAEREVILAGGAINSPHLLMTSGIGDTDQLRSQGVDAWHHLPGVGQNLQDHLEIGLQHSCDKKITLVSSDWTQPHRMIGLGLKWIFTRRGWAGTTHLESGAFIRSRYDIKQPDLQFHFLPGMIHEKNQEKDKAHAYQIFANPLRPKSSGQLTLKSSNPRKTPSIDFNYLACSDDRTEMRSCIRMARDILHQPALTREYGGVELSPGSEIHTDASLDQYIRAYANAAYHACGSCRMGLTPEGEQIGEEEAEHLGYIGNGRIRAAVTTPDCSVHGLDNLRVVDSSIMPSIVSGNLNAAVIMLAERAADIILSTHYGHSIMLLPAKETPYWVPEHAAWEDDAEM